MSPTLSLILVLVIIVLMFVAAGSVYLVSKKKAKQASETSLPDGSDLSPFARKLQERYASEGNNKNEF